MAHCSVVCIQAGSGIVIGGPTGRSPRVALVKGGGMHIERIVKKYVV